MSNIPFVKIKAKNNYDFGFKLGSKLKEQINYRLSKNKELYKIKVTKVEPFPVYIRKAKKFLPSIKKTFPNLLEEAQGMADGSGIPLEELLVLMCEEQIVDFKILHCLSIGLKTKNNELLLGNNEDWIPEYRTNGLALVNGKIKNNKFLGLGYMGYLTGSACGFNKYGIAYTDNSFVLNKFKYGIPRSFQLRALLDAKSKNNVIKTLNKNSSVSSNTMIIYKNKITSVERYITHKNKIYESKKLLVHTNHPLDKKLQNKKNTKRESIRRFDRALELLSKEKNYSINTYKKIFSDHKNKEYMAGICEHPKKKYKNATVATLASVIMNPKDKWMLLCDTNPCKGTYKKYRL